MNQKPHFLIVGAGLAGTCLSLHLLRSGARVTLVDSGVNHSSLIAAGMINPLVFRRMTKSWRIDEFMPYLTSFYRSVETESRTSFFHPVRIRRLFSHEQERDFWLKKQDLPDFEPYMEKHAPEDDAYSGTPNTWGSGRVKQAAYVDVHRFLPAIKALVAQEGTLLNTTLSYTEIEGAQFRETEYDGIVFCEGYLGKNNPWFRHLPLGQTKGETLLIRTPELPETESLNRKCFVLPLGDHRFKVGATYQWNDSSLNTTEEGREVLLEKLRSIYPKEPEILLQEAGVRPTTADRRPLMGTHNEFPKYHIFNGLGTKGYMTAPLLSREFCDYLLHGTPLHPEVCITRFE